MKITAAFVVYPAKVLPNMRLIRHAVSTRNCRDLARIIAAAAMVVLAVAFSATADVVTTSDGQSYRGTVRLTNASFMITQTNGTQSNVAMSNLTSVVFADGEEVFPGEHSLSAPWSSQDIGAVGVPGGARQTSNSFAVRASGAGLGG